MILTLQCDSLANYSACYYWPQRVLENNRVKLWCTCYFFRFNANPSFLCLLVQLGGWKDDVLCTIYCVSWVPHFLNAPHHHPFKAYDKKKQWQRARFPGIFASTSSASRPTNYGRLFQLRLQEKATAKEHQRNFTASCQCETPHRSYCSRVSG